MQGPSHVERGCAADFAGVVESARKDEQNASLMVYGPRGVGKTYMVAAALQNMTGVLTAAVQGGADFEQAVERAVLKVAGLTSQGTGADTGDRLRAILTAHKRVYSQRAIIVIDINMKVQPAQLSDMLLTAKQLEFEDGLATFVFVVSASRSALGLPVGIKESRVEGYSAPDFTEEEAHQYIKRCLPDFPSVAANITNLVGDRAMDLVSVCQACRGVTSAEECVERAQAYIDAGIEGAQDTLRDFLAIASMNAPFSKAASALIFEQLLAGTPVLRISDACAACEFGLTDQLLAALARKHAFVVDPFTRRISMQSYFMRIAMEEYLAAHQQQQQGDEQ